MRYFWLILLIIPCLLFSEDIVTLPFNLISIAYNNMLTGNYEIAEKQYQQLTILYPQERSGWEGLLWSQNAQGKFHKSLKTFSNAKTKLSELDGIYNYYAFALYRQNRLPEARYYYKQALDNMPANPLANQVSCEGLAYTYLALDNYPKAQKYFSKAAFISGRQMSAIKPSFNSTVYYKVPGTEKNAYGFRQSAKYKCAELKLNYEYFQLDNAFFRDLYKADFTYQFIPLEVGINGSYLSGEDARVYPAWQLGMELCPKLYPGKIVLNPELFVSFSHYPRFDVQQLSLQPQVLWRDFSFSYALHSVFMDNEPSETDSVHFAQQFCLTKSLPYSFELGFHYGAGNDTWIIDNSGVIIDTFNQNGSYYGISLGKEFFKHLYLYGYYQKWDSEDLFYFSLSGYY
ncbi:MAG TPA: hypothetical protein PLW08_02460 [Candidatus Cloacimonas acidaminovorans]|nr:hypothetical protein [Candidatus Cloacimonas acidaminovorans]